MPGEIPHAPTKLFYKQELFLSTVDGTHPIVAIVGKCAVLDYGEYICSMYIKYYIILIKPLIKTTYKCDNMLGEINKLITN